MKKSKKILITGGSGFLGSHVADAFSDSGYLVTIFDKKESSWRRKNQKFIKGDILDEKKVGEVIKNFDAVLHFAGASDIDEANKDPLNTIKSNIIGTSNILEACSKSKISRLIFASSIYVYSDHGGFYRSTKQACELLIENYYKEKKLNFTILRFGSLYGRRANRFNWINNIIYQALTKNKMERHGSGDEIRDYIHVFDAAKACVSILDEKFKNKYVMLKGSQTIKIKDLMKMIKEIINKNIKIKFLPQINEEHYEITPYSFRPRTALKYIADTQMDLGEGVLDTVYEVYKKIHGKEFKKPKK